MITSRHLPPIENTTHPGSQLQLSPQSLVKLLFSTYLLLLIGHLFVLSLIHIFKAEDAYGLIPLLYFDQEHNLPTLFSVLLILLASLSCFAIAYHTLTRQRHYWYLLSLVFAFLALDEFGSIHERLIQPVRTTFSLTGFFHFAWIIPYAIFVLLLAAVSLKWLLNLPRPVRNGFIASAFIYLTGVFLIEGISGFFYQVGAEHQSLSYDLLVTIEESCEIIGLIIFLYFTSLYLIYHLKIKGVQFQLK